MSIYRSELSRNDTWEFRLRADSGKNKQDMRIDNSRKRFMVIHENTEQREEKVVL